MECTYYSRKTNKWAHVQQQHNKQTQTHKQQLAHLLTGCICVDHFLLGELNPWSLMICVSSIPNLCWFVWVQSLISVDLCELNPWSLLLCVRVCWYKLLPNICWCVCTPSLCCIDLWASSWSLLIRSLLICVWSILDLCRSVCDPFRIFVDLCVFHFGSLSECVWFIPDLCWSMCDSFLSSILHSWPPAALPTLQAGDEVVRVNGLTLSQATHEEVVNLLRLKKTLTLSLRGQSRQSVILTYAYKIPVVSWQSLL